MAGGVSVYAFFSDGADRPGKAAVFPAASGLRPAYGSGRSGITDVRPVLCRFRVIRRGHVRHRLSGGMAASTRRQGKASRLRNAALRGTAASPVCGIRFYAGFYPL